MTDSRPISEGMEGFLQEPISVLDSGFIRVVDYMGNDSAIVQAARVSYGEGTRTPSDDEKLIRYLMKHRHTTPFEMCEIKLHMKLPIFVARQMIRHRTASVNEYSARYSTLGKQFYIPEEDHLAEQSLSNRQGRGRRVTPEEARAIQERLGRSSGPSYDDYLYLLNDPEREGHDPNRPQLARELARMCLNLNYYTEWYWKVDLHNLFHFLRLRLDEHAQYEIRVYAEAISKVVEAWVPYAWGAFVEYSLKSCTLSRLQMRALCDIVALKNVKQADTGLTIREWGELIEAIRLKEEDVDPPVDYR